MSGEALFKSIVSGENQSILGDIARSSLGFLSKGYEKAVSMRNAKFDEGKGVTKVTVPVISVGNITAGGTGKTPMVRFICDVLTQKGLHPTVLSRGYRAEDNKKNIIISKDGTMLVEPTISGDEAWLLAKVLQKSNVIIGRERSKSAEIAINELGANCLVMDDGFQHRALARDIDIVLIDASNPFGYDHVFHVVYCVNHSVVLQRAHIIVLTKVDQVAPGIVSGVVSAYLSWFPIYLSMKLHINLNLCIPWSEWANGTAGAPVDSYKDQCIMAVSGIGNPHSFTQTLTDVGYNVVHTLAVW